MTHRFAVTVLIVLVAAAQPLVAAEKSETFDRDPKWDALNNRVVPERPLTVTQDFGYRPATGDIGGRVTRASVPAYYAQRIEPRTLNDKLSASGTFALEKSGSGSGMFFGWFSADQPGSSGRPPNSFGLELGTERSGGRLAVRMINGKNESVGTFVTRYEPYKDAADKAVKRPTSIKNDGTRYHWTLNYDPDGAEGNGRFQFTVKRDRAAGQAPDYFEEKTFTVDLRPGFKQTGATFDRFGLMNGTKPGGIMVVAFDDVTRDGKPDDFARDPGWIESGNRATYQTNEIVAAHDFGYSPGTHFAGGKSAGEIGGSLWRSGNYAYYADAIGPLSMDDRLEARGRVMFKVGGPDSDMFFGWFGGGAKDESPGQSGEFVGVHVGGPTRVGHYFHPPRAEGGPVLTPGKSYPFSIVYDPAGGSGHGAVTVKLGDESITHALKAAHRKKGVTFDRFGLCTNTAGGQVVKIYFDDLTYTATRAAP